MKTVEEFRDAARQLTPDERELLAVQLLADLKRDREPGYEEAWSAEIRSRLDDIDSGRVRMIPGDEVMANIRSLIDAPLD
jgi:putative addiction module component (TIGR02574 family)